MMNRKKRVAILQCLRAANPAPQTELVYSTAFQLLIAVMLSAQATDISVNKATARLWPLASTPQQMLALELDNLRVLIKTIGLFNTKANNILKTCLILVEKYNGNVPENRAALEALPGVGRKTASVVLNTAFGWPVIAVDTHIFRVCNRTGFAPGNTVRQVEEKLARVVPDTFKQHCHHWLILHGRYTCTARKPRCSTCIIKTWCEFKEKTGP